MSYLKKFEYEIVLKDSFWVIRNCRNLFLLVSVFGNFQNRLTIWGNVVLYD